MSNLEGNTKPRSAKNAEKTGAYLLASRVFSNVIDKEDILEFEQYVTGYGEIRSPKLQCYFSPDVFDSKQSEIIHSFKANGPIPTWGGISRPIRDPGFTCFISGFPFDSLGEDEDTSFIDVAFFGIEGGPTSIMTERQLENAPFHYKLKTKKEVKPGNYSIDFYFTYFNGERWICIKESVDFKVRNYFEKHARPTTIVAIVASTLTIYRFGIAPLYEFIVDNF